MYLQLERTMNAQLAMQIGLSTAAQTAYAPDVHYILTLAAMRDAQDAYNGTTLDTIRARWYGGGNGIPCLTSQYPLHLDLVATGLDENHTTTYYRMVTDNRERPRLYVTTPHGSKTYTESQVESTPASECKITAWDLDELSVYVGGLGSGDDEYRISVDATNTAEHLTRVRGQIILRSYWSFMSAGWTVSSAYAHYKREIPPPPSTPTQTPA
jgi:hypothetical protein